MHTLRHTAAMRLLLAGNDITVIALWLGHEQITTTQIYLHADMTHKQQAIDRTRPLTAGRIFFSGSLSCRSLQLSRTWRRRVGRGGKIVIPPA